MARHDVHRNPKGGGFILDVQNDIFDIIGSRVVVPLMPGDTYVRLAARLNPEFEIDGRRYVMLTQLIAAVPAAILGAPAANLGEHHGEITEALDMLFQGF
ncbi:MAG: CcdB family protein [Rhizobiaceae bacterium]